MDTGKVSCSDGAGRFPCAVCSGSVPTYKHNGYECGTKWSISEYELDKALARYRQKNQRAKGTTKKGRHISKQRMWEAIIEIATYGLVRLG